jgi:heat shock protein HslJ
MKILAAIVLVLLFLVGGFYAFNAYIYQEKQGDGPVQDPKDATYVISGEAITLSGGVAEQPSAPGSASKTITRYFGNEVKVDLDQDMREDTVFLLTQETGGSGTFYYVVAALNKETGYEGSQALFLGDRIAPQTTEKGTGNMIIVNYADRAPGESLATAPSVGKSMRLLFDATTMQFGEVVQDFEGEADPSRMTLGMKTWVWISALYNDEREVLPKKKDAFTLTFGTDGRFSAKTDCNQVGGTYAASGGQLTFGDMFSTKMFCEGSQEEEFTKMLSTVSGFHFTSKGELILDLKYDSGSVIFR